MAAARTSKGITGRHVLIGMIAFFGVIIGLDSLFISFALRSHPGEEVRNSYVLGLEYNRELERKAEQRSLGWSVEAGVIEQGEPLFAVRVSDQSGAPLSGLDVSVHMHVAGVAADGATLKLAERKAGEYVVPVQLARKGRVTADITVRRTADGADVFEAQKTLVLS